MRRARACSVSVETDHALDSLFGRIFYGKPVSTFPENALVAQLRGEADQRQVEFARLALQHNLGLGGACVVTLYGR